MAAFDPIEFFGIGHNRDIAIVRHAKAGSETSISLSSIGTTPYIALQKSDPERPWLPQSHSRATSREPQSLHRTFTDITPESSVYIPTSGFDVVPFESPNVSVNSSWVSNLDQLFSIGRYLGNHERHEMILLSLSAAPQRAVLSIPSALNISRTSDERGLAEEQPNMLRLEVMQKETGSTPNDGPLYRYLTDAQPHELLSLALEGKGHPTAQKQAQCSHEGTRQTNSSISLSAALDGGEPLEKDEETALAAEVARRCRELRRQRALGQPRLQPRLYRMKMARKRRSESPPQGHRDKVARQR